MQFYKIICMTLEMNSSHALHQSNYLMRAMKTKNFTTFFAF